MTTRLTILVFMLLVFAESGWGQQCPANCVPNSGYPWPACGCLNVLDLNTAFTARPTASNPVYSSVLQAPGLSVSGNKNVTVSPSAFTAFVWSDGNFIGNLPSSTGYYLQLPAGLSYPLNYLSVTNDTIAAPNDGLSGQTNNIPALTINHNFGGSTTALGGRSGLDINLRLLGATGNSTQTTYNNFYPAVSAYGYAATADGGTGGVPRGDLYGVLGTVTLVSGATNWAGLHGGVSVLTAASGASTAAKVGYEVALQSGDAVQGSGLDAAYLISNRGSAGWKTGFMLGLPSGGSNPLTTNIMVAPQPFTVIDGIDLSNVTFSGKAWKSNGLSIDGAGKIRNTGAPTSCSGQLSGTLANVSGTATFCP